MKIRCMIIFFLVNCLAFSYINIYPLEFDQRIDKMGGIKDFVLTNTTKNILKYRFDIIGDDSSDLDMSEWTEIYPRSVILEPGHSKSIKMYIRAPKNTETGEYSTVLSIRELELPINSQNDKKINVYTNLKIKLYGYVGALNTDIELKDFDIVKNQNLKELKIKGNLENKSLKRIKLELILGTQNDEDGILLSNIKLKKGEKLDLSTLVPIDAYHLSLEEYSKLDTVYFYEKETGKLVKKVRLRS